MLSWDRFRELPGAPDQLFESLCRAIVQRNYGRCGSLRSRRNQPGVEFFMRLDSACDLGDPGRVFGWSCKWFPLPDDNELTASRRTQVEDSIDKAVEYVDGLTDFVLCLPELPAKKDLDWYFGLAAEKGVALHLWADEELAARMTGGAEILRRTFFGELIVVPDQLAATHERAVAPVSRRWIPGLHVMTHVEHDIAIALLRPNSLEHLRKQAQTLAELADRAQAQSDELDEVPLREQVAELAREVARFAQHAVAIVDAVDEGHPDEAAELLEAQAFPSVSPRALRDLVRELRKRRAPLALLVSAFDAEIRLGLRLLNHAASTARASTVVVVGAAGHGKTQLAAQITSTNTHPVAGIFMQGADLRQGNTLDHLAARVPGLGISSFDDLLEALDAAGARSGSRLPLVIDGLTESERPAEWRALLEQLLPALGGYPNVLVIVTLRPALREQLIPEQAAVLELEWQEGEVDDVVRRYFEHYLIDPGGAWLPLELFRNPLLLRLYCEAANGERRSPVGVEALPSSLIGVFELYRARVADRLATDPARAALPPGHVERQLARLAMTIWDRQARIVSYDEAKELIDGAGVSWDDSLYRRLEEEGILFRDEREGYLNQKSGILFDRFAGYLIADAMLTSLRYDELSEAFRSDELWTKVLGESAHPLGEDVLVALVGLLPRRFYGQQLWILASSEHKPHALPPTLGLEAHLLDDDTVEELASLIAEWPPPRFRRRHPFNRLFEVHDGPNHPLNAAFLDRVLRSMPMSSRDRSWSEWLRIVADDEVRALLSELIEQWEESDVRDESDELSAVLTTWVLASTQLVLRDLATKALQRYGRAAPGKLFSLAPQMLAVDDPYIEERVIAAAFGAMTAHQMPDPGGPFERALEEWLQELKRRYLEGGDRPTSHELIRTYVRSSFEFAAKLHPSALPSGIDADALVFAPPPVVVPIHEGDQHAEECNLTFGMDFENYVIGSAIEERANYQRDHPVFVAAMAEVRGRVWELGWRAQLFEAIDRGIAEEQWRRQTRPDRVERYGKKYGWIGYYELVGRLDDAGKVKERYWLGGDRIVTPDIDPTFPEEPAPVPIELPAWVKSEPADDAAWVESGLVEVARTVWTPDLIADHVGPWFVAEGFLEQRHHGRKVFGFYRSLILDSEHVDLAVAMIAGRDYLGNHFLPSCPEHHAIYAGELPWSQRFSLPSEEGLPPNHRLLQEHWQAPGLDVELMATNFAFEGSRTTTDLSRSYDVPSYEFAEHFDLRQFPGTLNLVSLDGSPAALVFRAEGEWSGRLLYVRKDLALEYAQGRKIVLVVWGEREVTVDWYSPPQWLRDVHERHAHLWREAMVVE